VVLLALPLDQVLERVVELRGSQKEHAVLTVLQGSTGPVWVGGIYAQTGADLSTLRKLSERGLLSLHAEDFSRPVLSEPQASPELTMNQAAVWHEIQHGLERSSHPVLLHGVTGSGKTEIYMRAVAATLAVGRRAIILVPEISLTPQLVRRFQARFPGRVGVLHGQLSLGQRYAVWDQVRSGEVDVIVGSRLALFAPMSRLGLVVLDEAHDGSYKQTEPIPLPAYHARDVAIALGRLTGAAVLLGSATPDLDLYYRARQGELRLLELGQRVAGGLAPDAGKPLPLPKVRVVDLRQELRAGNRSIFSRALQAELGQALEAGEQAILFLNRRGAATFVICRDCGYVAQCPNCDIPLTYHRSVRGASSESEQLVCHRCNRRQRAPRVCQDCGGRRVRYFGLGTEGVERAVHELFPSARLLRWDRDTASGLDHERFLQSFVEHRADVLIGTQMIAKGLDLPLVTLVGVISADTALNLPDFRAAERTFQLLTQVVGRAGRSHRGGQAIIQTYNPEHYAIRAAARHDYATYYQQEIGRRQVLGYPPFGRMVALRVSDPDPHRCRAEAVRMGHWLGSEIRRLGLSASLIGPAPCFLSRVRGRYRWQIVIMASEPRELLRDVALPWGWQVDVDPISLL
jgi:primosomal protein N' (replication factor Y)